MLLTEMGLGALLLFCSLLGVFQKGKQKFFVISVEPKVKLGLVFFDNVLQDCVLIPQKYIVRTMII